LVKGVHSLQEIETGCYESGLVKDKQPEILCKGTYNLHEIEGLCLDQSHAKYEHRLVEDTVSNVFFYIEIGHLE